MGSRPSPVRSPEQNKNHKTLEKLRSSLSASNPLLSQQLSRFVCVIWLSRRNYIHLGFKDEILHN